MKSPTITVVGGLGRMGALMARLFTEAGHEVHIVDTRAGHVSWKKAARNDLVLLAVPIPAMEDVIKAIGPFTREDGVVVDIASIKDAPVRTMLKHCRGEVIGSHPLCGPHVSSLQGQLVFIHPARSTYWFDWYKSFLLTHQANVVEIDPLRHDRLMARVQVLRHVFLLCFGRSLMRLDFDLEGDMPLSGPWFTQLIGMLSHQLQQDPELYADLASHNPAAEEVFNEFVNAADEVTGSFGLGDKSKIVELINEVTSYIRSVDPARNAA